jgi:hypothetical protein
MQFRLKGGKNGNALRFRSDAHSGGQDNDGKQAKKSGQGAVHGQETTIWTKGPGYEDNKKAVDPEIDGFL